MGKRWYELSPDVCIVISKIEMSKEEDRTRYAKIMLKELDEVNIDSLEELRAKEKLNRLYHNLEEQLRGKPKFD